MLIRATDATHVFAGLDLSRLQGALEPSRVVTATDVANAGIRVPEFYEGDLFCPVGKTPLYLGQPLAMLIFEQFDVFDQARLALRAPSCAKYGRETGPVAIPPYGSHRFVRVAGATPQAPDIFSPLQDGWVVPRSFRDVDIPVWAPADRQGPVDAQASFYGGQIRAELAADDPNLLVLDRQFETQSVDPVFLEPEAGIAWYDASGRKLEVVLGTQSPMEATQSLAYLLGEARPEFKPAKIHGHFAYLGGGFGGRDHTIMPLYIALAAMFFPDRPVRLGNNRYEQFQSGVKRAVFKMRSRIGIDRTTGRICAFAADHILIGGGLGNFSGQVGDVGATAAIGASGLVCDTLGGWLSDRWGRKPVMIIPWLLLIVAIYPSFWLLEQLRTRAALWTVSAVLNGIQTLSSATIIVAVTESLPKRVRSGAVALIYALAISVFGGSTQFLVAWIIHTTSNPLAPAWYMLGAVTIGLLAMLQLPETAPVRKGT